jgi:hypothetical protein
MAPPLGLTLSGSAPTSFCPREHDRGEGLVDLEGVDVVDLTGRCGRACAGGVDRAGEHEHRVDADQARVDDAGTGLEAERGGLLLGHHQHGLTRRR